MKKIIYIKALLVFCVLIAVENTFLQAQNKSFTLVIDAGHGAHDAGAKGKIAKEKDINLAVALTLGKLISDNHEDVKVVFTRKTDVFLDLWERAAIANRNNADFFISIHTNAAKSSKPYGAETYTLGLHKTQANLDVAMRENAVILLEKDNKTKYKDFDPSSVDSYIMFEFMQDKNIDRSITFASEVQNQFKNNVKRYDRGVRQAGFLVLHATAAPSVLVELGFISNAEEEKFLASKDGQAQMAKSIYNAFSVYKHNHDKRSGKIKDEKQKTNENTDERENGVESKDSVTAPLTSHVSPLTPVFKVQFIAQPKKMSEQDFRGLKNVDFYQEDGYYKYTVGNTSDYTEIQNLKKEVQIKFKDAFIIAFLGDKKISVMEALKLKVKS